jgi:hypothetical protein
MVMALGVLAVLAVLAIVIATVVSSEKRTEVSKYANTRSFYSADAAGEAGVHWLTVQTSPPTVLDSLNHVTIGNTYTALANEHLYRYDIEYVGKRFRPGWSVEFKDYYYKVNAQGASSGQSQAAIEINTARLYREGY